MIIGANAVQSVFETRGVSVSLLVQSTDREAHLLPQSAVHAESAGASCSSLNSKAVASAEGMAVPDSLHGVG